MKCIDLYSGSKGRLELIVAIVIQFLASSVKALMADEITFLSACLIQLQLLIGKSCRQRKHVSQWTATAFTITIDSISAWLGNPKRRLGSSQLMKERNFWIRANYKVAIATTKCKRAFRTCCIFKLNANAKPNECIWLALNGAFVRLCLSPCDMKM